MSTTKDREIQTINIDRLRLQQLANPVKSSATQRAQPSVSPINMRWELLPNAPTKMSAGSSAVIGDRVYNKTSDSQTIHQFNSSNQQWSTLPKHPIIRFTIVNVENTLTTVGGLNKLYSYVD